jgi:hypothetical protein
LLCAFRRPPALPLQLMCALALGLLRTCPPPCILSTQHSFASKPYSHPPALSLGFFPALSFIHSDCLGPQRPHLQSCKTSLCRWSPHCRARAVVRSGHGWGWQGEKASRKGTRVCGSGLFKDSGGTSDGALAALGRAGAIGSGLKVCVPRGRPGLQVIGRFTAGGAPLGQVGGGRVPRGLEHWCWKVQAVESTETGRLLPFRPRQ